MSKQRVFIVIGLVWALVSCSGDGRPLQEAVEANELNLGSIAVQPPAGAVVPLSAGVGERLAFTLVARDRAGRIVDAASTNRRWSSSNPAVASIDENGHLLTRAVGSATIDVRIGAIVSAPFELDVDNALLSSITRIEGDASIERCQPQEYRAIGLYGSNERAIPDVVWSVDDATLGRSIKLPDARARVTAINVGVLNLTASVGAISSDPLAIEVLDTLQSIRLLPQPLDFEVGDTQQLSAFGAYTTDTGERSLPITSSVTWQVPPETDVASVDTSTSNYGLLTALEIGITEVSASCGTVSTLSQVVVGAEGSGSSTSNLTFQETGPVQLSLSGSTFQLRVSTGSTYDSNNDVTDQASWSVIGTSGIVSVDNGTNRGRVTPTGVGRTTVRATYSNATRDIDIEVSQ